MLREKSRCGEEKTYAKKTAQNHVADTAVGGRRHLCLLYEEFGTLL
jgi:hypothetical protein